MCLCLALINYLNKRVFINLITRSTLFMPFLFIKENKISTCLKN